MNKAFKPGREFEEVFANASWEDIHSRVPNAPKGWFELPRLSVDDRIQFVSDFWRKTLPYVPHIDLAMNHFFSSLADIRYYLFKKEDWKAVLVYVLGQNDSFYMGFPPLENEEKIKSIEQALDATLPKDYGKFIMIHDGFAKKGEKGIFPLNELLQMTEEVKNKLKNRKIDFFGEKVEPNALIPFYYSEIQKGYQCFNRNWYPLQEMGNFFLSFPNGHFFENVEKEKNLAFPTFLDWLIGYINYLRSNAFS